MANTAALIGRNYLWYRHTFTGNVNITHHVCKGLEPSCGSGITNKIIFGKKNLCGIKFISFAGHDWF